MPTATPQIAVLTEGLSNPISAKTAVSLLKYRPGQVVALVDAQAAGQTAQQALGFGGDVPIVANLDAARSIAPIDTLAIGVAPAGGKLPPAMRAAVLDAASTGLTVLSGLHQFLGSDPDIAAAAQRSGAKLVDVRKCDERDVADRKGLNDSCLRIHTVGNDCSVGKMMSSVELTLGLHAAGVDAKFVATGQTGIMVANGVNAGLPPRKLTEGELDDPSGGGVPIDAVVADFINGAAEKLVKRNQHHDVIILEGQATLAHPSYSSVTYGLLHGCLPHGLIMCLEAERPHMVGRPHLGIPDMDMLLKLYEHVGSIEQPCRFIGFALNARLLKGDAQKIDAHCKKLEDQYGLPCCDVITQGPGKLVDAVKKLKTEFGK